MFLRVCVCVRARTLFAFLRRKRTSGRCTSLIFFFFFFIETRNCNVGKSGEISFRKRRLRDMWKISIIRSISGETSPGSLQRVSTNINDTMIDDAALVSLVDIYACVCGGS